MMRAVSGHAFEIAFNAARDASPLIAGMTSPFEHADGTTYYAHISRHSAYGYAIRQDDGDGGELVYVFSTVRGMGDAIVAHAVVVGASHLDCFDGYLPTLYARHGFVVTRRESNWTPGGPDVVYMRRP